MMVKPATERRILMKWTKWIYNQIKFEKYVYKSNNADPLYTHTQIETLKRRAANALRQRRWRRRHCLYVLHLHRMNQCIVSGGTHTSDKSIQHRHHTHSHHCVHCTMFVWHTERESSLIGLNAFKAKTTTKTVCVSVSRAICSDSI